MCNEPTTCKLVSTYDENWVNSNVISHSCGVKIWLVYHKDTYDVGLNNQHLRYFSDIDPQ